jgi:hypothetical protein
VARPTAADRRAAIRYGPSVRRIAQRYRNPYTGKRLSGAALLLKVASGESGFNDNAVSSAGARGRTQFMPATRAAVLKRFGVDPWGSVDDAYHATALHLRGKLGNAKGLEGYNPGDPSYTNYILKQKVGKIRGAPGGTGGAASGVSGTPGTPGSVGAQNLPMGSTGALDALAALAQQPASPPPSALPAPSFAAAPTLPQGYQPVQSGGGPEPKVDVASLIDQIRTPGGDVQLAPGVPGTAGSDAVTGGFGSSPTGKGRGRVVVAPGADRAGVHTGAAVLDFAREVSGIAGETLRIGTGTRHSRMTVNGNVSDHWSGNAVDIPARGKSLIRLGQAALIAAGMSPREARKQTGGLYNVGGHQVIFNTHEGGDHTNHLHISARGRRR